jgi:hypothetical protein
VSLATGGVTRPAMRRHTSEWAARKTASKNAIQVPRRFRTLKTEAPRSIQGESGEDLAGSKERGTHEEDDRATWEAPISPGKAPGTGEPGKKPQRSPGSERLREPAKKKRPQPGRPKARGTGAEAEGDRGVGGPNKSEDDGERQAPDPEEQRRPVLR